MNLAAGVRLDARGRPAARGASRQVKPANDILRLPAVTFCLTKRVQKPFKNVSRRKLRTGLLAGRTCLASLGRALWPRTSSCTPLPPILRPEVYSPSDILGNDRCGFGVQGGDLCVLRDGSADEHPRVAERGQVYPGADGRRPGRPLLLHAVRPPNLYLCSLQLSSSCLPACAPFRALPSL